MLCKNLKLITILLFGLGLISVQAQKSIVISGGEISGKDGIVSYSIGQIFYTVNTGTPGFVLQGVQQPYEISVIMEIKEAKDISLKLSVYPNPATDLLTLRVENLEHSTLRFQLFDSSGKLLKSNQIKNKETDIYLNNLRTSVYFLRINNKHKAIKTFKIVKK